MPLITLQPPIVAGGGALDLALPAGEQARGQTEVTGGIPRLSRVGLALPREMNGVEVGKLKKVSVEIQTDHLETLKPVSFTVREEKNMSNLQFRTESFPAASLRVRIQNRTYNSSLESIPNINSRSATQEQPNLYELKKIQFSKLRHDVASSRFLSVSNTTHSAAATSNRGGNVRNV